ncbi:DUF302 domain-containing protein [Leifsonia sp. NCR5]|uniref:DUF302 domain-containing protein n=1 Tax=Leifsonia sp. NCR5 TaxID=1978342 RepID=UPI000A18ABB8|nr:DUF302 domain-containing protein [Leifsonia sp. NCR5]
MGYTITTTLPLPFPEAVNRVRAALSEQGFGVLTEIDVRRTFENKLGAEAADAVGDYLILGACNPKLAQRALKADPQIGALLPCNVVIRGAGTVGTSIVEAIDPQTMVQLTGSPEVQKVADEAGTLLRAALDSL